jgi:VanZ family protein
MFKNFTFNFIFLITIISISFISFLPNYDQLPKIASLSDHINHFVAFFTLSFLLIFGLKLSKNLTIFYMFIYGLSIECFQYFLPNRVFGIDDIIFDMLGVIFFIYIYKRVLSCH